MREKTQDDYMKLASHFYKKRLADVRIENLTPKVITDALLKCASDYRPAYFRKLKNALMFDQTSKGFPKAAARIKATMNPLTRPNAAEMIKRKIKPKQNRVKAVSDDDLSKLKAKVKEDGDLEVYAALRIAELTGCRPAEMQGITQISDTVIFIKGAKGNDDGNRGLDRYLTLDESAVKAVVNTVAYLNEKDTDNFKTGIIHRIQARLSTHTKSTFPKRKSQITLYSFRHQLGANLKASKLDRVSIAYVMGHQSTGSVDVYGDRRKVSGKIHVSPGVALEEQKAVVRVTHEKPLSSQVKSAPVHQKQPENDGGLVM